MIGSRLLEMMQGNNNKSDGTAAHGGGNSNGSNGGGGHGSNGGANDKISKEDKKEKWEENKSVKRDLIPSAKFGFCWHCQHFILFFAGNFLCFMAK